MFTLFDECLCLNHADKAVQMQPIHTPQLRQALLQELRAVLHSPLHSRFSRPLPLLLHSRLHASSVESPSLSH